MPEDAKMQKMKPIQIRESLMQGDLMSKANGRIDLAKFRETAKEQREQAKRGPEGHTIRSRAVIRLLEDQLKEARVGEYTLFCDEAKSRRGGGRAPGPLAYFIAAIGF
jgi:hypothetical protein